MIEHYVASLGLNRGLRVSDYESVTELETAAGEVGACLRFSNKYLVEKSALPDGRDKFATELEKRTGFPMKIKVTYKEKSDGTKEKTEEVDESEVQYVNRFRKAILDGTFVHQSFPRNERDLEDALQVFADSLGVFAADAKRPERQPGKPKIAKWIAERVAIIMNNGTQDRWWDIMAKEAVPIDPLTGDKDKDTLALCRAIKEREARREAEEARKYA